MKKSEYEAPEIELLKFKTEDCITASSDDTVGEDQLP